MQTEVGEGPCLLAYGSGEAVSIPDLTVEDRFPRFAPLAVAAGMAAVFTFPLLENDRRLGALDLYRDTPGTLDAADMHAAQTLADVAAAYLTNVQAKADAYAVADHFRQTSLHDALTGLPNRSLLQQRLEHAVDRGRRSHEGMAVVFADLDHFKAVNDTHGHQVGDDLLIAVGNRLTRLIRPGDTLARVSGDEFVILCEDLNDTSFVESLAGRVERAFATPFRASGLELSITASLGIAFAGHGEDVSTRLIHDADTAMYEAKRLGRGRHRLIDLRETVRAAGTQHLEADLRGAVARGDLDVHYQPIVRSADGLLVGVEALVRWQHPTEGLVPAHTVVAMAEESALISQIGKQVLQRACLDRSRWLSQGATANLDIAVNVSTTQLVAPGFLADVSSVLRDTDTDPRDLTLELTEDIFIVDVTLATTVLSDLRELGVRIALDDFGTGYSSLSYLRHLPVDVLKFDQTFLADVAGDPAAGIMLTAMTNLAHLLDLSVTAEGVETQRQRDKVAAAGCETSQGFFYAPPLAAHGVERLLQRSAGAAFLPMETPALAEPLRS